MIGGIVLTHGQISSTLIQAAKAILGEVDHVYDLSITNQSMSRIISDLEQIVFSQNWDEGIIIMVSLKGGSCWNSAVNLARKFPQIEVVSGVNLIMLISFISKRIRVPLKELAEIIKEDAIRGIDRFSLSNV